MAQSQGVPTAQISPGRYRFGQTGERVKIHCSLSWKVPTAQILLISAVHSVRRTPIPKRIRHPFFSLIFA